MQYRRVFVPGGTYFFTVVTFQRRGIFTTDDVVNIFRQAVRTVLSAHPFTINAAVILPDHLHMIWTLPDRDSDYPTRWRLIKGNFTRNWPAANAIINTGSRIRKGEQAVWQRRYWEHLVRDETDLQHHVEYIHYNPVKHGLADAPVNWKYSSFHAYVRQERYPQDWGSHEMIDTGLELE